MATTPILGLPSPDLGTTADGPAGIGALAARTERQMTLLQGATEYWIEPNTPYNKGTNNNVIHGVSVPTSVIGWIEAHVQVNLTMVAPSGPYVTNGEAFSGFLYLYIAGERVRSARVHNLWGTRTLNIHLFGAKSRAAADTTTEVQVWLDVGGGGDAGARGIAVNHSNIYVMQFGAPSSG